MLLPNELAVHDPHHFKLDAWPSDELHVNRALQIAQRVGDRGYCGPLAQATTAPRFFIRMADDLSDHLLKGPFGENGLSRSSVQKLIGNLDVSGNYEFVDLKILAICPNYIQAFAVP